MSKQNFRNKYIIKKINEKGHPFPYISKIFIIFCYNLFFYVLITFHIEVKVLNKKNNHKALEKLKKHISPLGAKRLLNFFFFVTKIKETPWRKFRYGTLKKTKSGYHPLKNIYGYYFTYILNESLQLGFLILFGTLIFFFLFLN